MKLRECYNSVSSVIFFFCLYFFFSSDSSWLLSFSLSRVFIYLTLWISKKFAPSNSSRCESKTAVSDSFAWQWWILPFFCFFILQKFHGLVHPGFQQHKWMNHLVPALQTLTIRLQLYMTPVLKKKLDKDYVQSFIWMTFKFKWYCRKTYVSLHFGLYR